MLYYSSNTKNARPLVSRPGITGILLTRLSVANGCRYYGAVIKAERKITAGKEGFNHFFILALLILTPSLSQHARPVKREGGEVLKNKYLTDLRTVL